MVNNHAPHIRVPRLHRIGRFVGAAGPESERDLAGDPWHRRSQSVEAFTRLTQTLQSGTQARMFIMREQCS